jgi:alanine racemase
MTRPIQARIRASALRNNLAVARRHAPDARLMAVIKANAYGHGLMRAARALQDADGLAVLDLDAALRLRAEGYGRRILLLEGFFDLPELPVMAQHHLATVVHCAEQLRMLEALPLSTPVDVFLKLNTGMNRLGLAAAELRPGLARLQASRNVGEITLMTHFACADEDRGIAWQLDRFEAVTAGLGLPVSLANSATLLRYPHAARDWVRAGIMLYGASPFGGESAAGLGLEPVMTLESRLIAVHVLSHGDAVGYGVEFRAPGPMRIGAVACGYADGYPRHAATGTPILVGGRRTRTLGRVSMDMLCVDLTDLPEAGVGSPVVLWGDGLPVEEVAAAAGTISYELLCALASRVPVVDIP